MDELIGWSASKAYNIYLIFKKDVDNYKMSANASKYIYLIYFFQEDIKKRKIVK